MSDLNLPLFDEREEKLFFFGLVDLREHTRVQKYVLEDLKSEEERSVRDTGDVLY